MSGGFKLLLAQQLSKLVGLKPTNCLFGKRFYVYVLYFKLPSEICTLDIDLRFLYVLLQLSNLFWHEIQFCYHLAFQFWQFVHGNLYIVFAYQWLMFEVL